MSTIMKIKQDVEIEWISVGHGGWENRGQDLDSLNWQISEGPFEKVSSELSPEYREGNQTCEDLGKEPEVERTPCAKT